MLGVTACSKDDDKSPDEKEDCSTQSLSYTSDIKAIVDGSCALPACHGGGQGLPNFTTYAGVFSKRSNIRSQVIAKSMPPSSQTSLSQASIDKIDCWVTNGAPE